MKINPVTIKIYDFREGHKSSEIGIVRFWKGLKVGTFWHSEYMNFRSLSLILRFV